MAISIIDSATLRTLEAFFPKYQKSPPTMLKLPEPKFNGYEISADLTLPFLTGVRKINIHGQFKHAEVVSEKWYREG